MALLMAQERSGGGSCVIFVFLSFSCKYGTRMNESFTKSRHDHLLFTFLFVFVSPAEHCSLENFSGPWCAIAVDLQSFEKTSETFDDARWILTIIWVAPECQDTTGVARPYSGTWLTRILTKMKEGYMKGALGMEVP
jgi:hypothetical protein